jgi:hypothetical protein
MIADPKDKSVFRLKFGLVITSFAMLVFVVISCLPYFGTEIPMVTAISSAVFGWFIFSEIYRCYKILINKQTVIIYKSFDLFMTIPVAVIFGLASIMLFIFFPSYAAVFFGLTFIVMFIHSALDFLIFDFANNSVSGLFGKGKSEINQLSIEVLPGNHQIRFKSPNHPDPVILIKNKVGDSTWNSLISNFNLSV